MAKLFPADHGLPPLDRRHAGRLVAAFALIGLAWLAHGVLLLAAAITADSNSNAALRALAEARARREDAMAKASAFSTKPPGELTTAPAVTTPPPTTPSPSATTPRAHPPVRKKASRRPVAAPGTTPSPIAVEKSGKNPGFSRARVRTAEDTQIPQDASSGPSQSGQGSYPPVQQQQQQQRPPDAAKAN